MNLLMIGLLSRVQHTRYDFHYTGSVKITESMTITNHVP